MSGKRHSSQPSDTKFFLDEGLPAIVGEVLSLVGYPISTPDVHMNRGMPDEELIPWLADNGYTWVTKDDEAKREHAVLIKKHGINVIWVRGIDRQKNKINVRDLHFMLTTKLYLAIDSLGTAHGARYFYLYMDSRDHAVLKPIPAEDVHPRGVAAGRGR